MSCCSRAQVISWIVTVVLIPTVCACLLPLAFPYCIYAFGLLYGIVLVQVLFLTVYDPAPQSVRDKRRSGHVPAARPSHRGHIIQDGYCTMCEVVVPAGSKHCRKCNKCAEGFDHHCVWLNTCIGSKNYPMFISLIVSLAAMLTVCLVMIALLIILGFTHVDDLLPLRQKGENTTISLQWVDVPLVGWILLDVVVFLLLGMLDALVIHLISFHIKLKRTGTTTFSYIQKKKRTSSSPMNSQNRGTTDTGSGGGVSDFHPATNNTQTVLSAATVSSNRGSRESQQQTAGERTGGGVQTTHDRGGPSHAVGHMGSLHSQSTLAAGDIISVAGPSNGEAAIEREERTEEPTDRQRRHGQLEEIELQPLESVAREATGEGREEAAAVVETTEQSQSNVNPRRGLLVEEARGGFREQRDSDSSDMTPGPPIASPFTLSEDSLSERRIITAREDPAREEEDEIALTQRPSSSSFVSTPRRGPSGGFTLFVPRRVRDIGGGQWAWLVFTTL